MTSTITCPHCNTRVELEAAVEDECARAFMRLLRRLGPAAPHAIGYVMLFKPLIQSLRWSRALALLEDVIQLTEQHGEVAVGQALAETVGAMQQKQGPSWRPLTGHGYLRKVLDSVAARPAAALTVFTPGVNTVAAPLRPVSKTAQAIELLRNYPTPADVPEWFTRTVCGSLAELVLMSLEGVPAHDTLGLVAERWLAELWPKRAWQPDSRFMGAKRLRDAFIAAAEERHRWPAVRDVLDRVPSA